jgi:hypothetical protein
MRAHHRAIRASQSAPQVAAGSSKVLQTGERALIGCLVAASLLMATQALAVADQSEPRPAESMTDTPEPENKSVASSSEAIAGAQGVQTQASPYLFGRVDFVSASAGATTWSSLAPVVTVERTRLLPPSGSWSGSTTTDPYGRQFTEMGSVTYRWWLNRAGRANVGFGVGTLGFLVTPIEGLGTGPHTLAYAAPTVTVGWRYQLSGNSTVYADASGARRVTSDARTDLYSTKLGMEWTTKNPSMLGFEKGALGVRLDSGLRMSLRVRRGGLGMYLRSQF